MKQKPTRDNDRSIFTIIPVLLLLVVISPGLVGCGGGGGDGSGVSQPPPPSQPPVANNACSLTPLSTPLDGDLKTFVTDPDNPTSQLSFSIAGQGSKGTASTGAAGNFTYTPTAGVRGADSFTYRVTDPSGGTAVGTVKVVIGQTRIMPLGDSITTGVTNNTDPPPALEKGYRKDLYNALTAAGYPFDFVGSRNIFGTDPTLQPFDFDSEGHEGWTSAEIANGTLVPSKMDTCPGCAITDWLDMNPPDIILLHIGTNEFTTSTSDVSAIFDKIDAWVAAHPSNPIRVFLARIINRNPYQSVDVNTYNNNLAGLALARDPAGTRIIMVDQHDALAYPQDLLADTTNGLHPDSTGYAKMASTWFTALTTAAIAIPDVLPKCP